MGQLRDAENCRCSCGCKRMGAKLKIIDRRTYHLLFCQECAQTHQKSPRPVHSPLLFETMVEYLLGGYATRELAIGLKTRLSKMEMLKQVARAWGLDPEKIPVKEASAYPHRTAASPIERDEAQSKTLAETLREAVRKDLSINS